MVAARNMQLVFWFSYQTRMTAKVQATEEKSLLEIESGIFAGAIDAILQNSQSANELLNRRKVLSDIIATYLKNVGVPIPSKITKAEVVLKTLAFWGELDSGIPTARLFTPSSITQRQAASASDFSPSFYFNTVKPSTSTPIEDASKIWTLGAQTSDLEQHKNKVSPPPPVYQPTHDEKSTREVVTSLTSLSLAGEYDVGHSVRSSKISTCPLRIDKGYAVNECVKGTSQKSQSSPVSGNVTYMTTRSMLQTARQPANVKLKTETVAAAPYTGVMGEEGTSSVWPVDCEKFTRDFCEWYYSLLNSQNASSGQHKNNWGPQHFLENAVLHLTYMSARGKYKGGRSVSACLLALVQENKFYFQPNITSRKVKCERSPKGVVVVIVSGTLFRNKSYVGTFDQVFEIVGNLRSNNWKIQFTDLKIIKSS